VSLPAPLDAVVAPQGIGAALPSLLRPGEEAPPADAVVAPRRGVAALRLAPGRGGAAAAPGASQCVAVPPCGGGAAAPQAVEPAGHRVPAAAHDAL
jgi:hypothetical protein